MIQCDRIMLMIILLMSCIHTHTHSPLHTHTHTPSHTHTHTLPPTHTHTHTHTHTLPPTHTHTPVLVLYEYVGTNEIASNTSMPCNTIPKIT